MHSKGQLNRFFLLAKPIIVINRRVIFPIKNSFFTKFKYNYYKVKKIICVSRAVQKVVVEIVPENNTTVIPSSVKLSKTEDLKPVLLKEEAILSGDSITYASMQFSQGKPAVSIRLGGGKESVFHKTTSQNIGRSLAVVYVDTEMMPVKIANKTTIKPVHHEKIISIATIQSALGQQFEITGLQSVDYADNLALLLRSGSLAAPVNIIQELTIGPSLGQANIDKGIFS